MHTVKSYPFLPGMLVLLGWVIVTATIISLGLSLALDCLYSKPSIILFCSLRFSWALFLISQAVEHIYIDTPLKSFLLL